MTELWKAIFWGICMTACAMAGGGDSFSAAADGGKDPEVESFNYVFGTQTIGIRYTFSDETGLVETARGIREMGSNILKIYMGDGYHGEKYRLPKREAVRSLTDLARLEPSHKTVLDMPFAYYHIWAYSFTGGGWAKGVSKEKGEREYREIYDFARYLLTEYDGSGKTFYLGHWEGDWSLLSGTDPSKDPTDEAVAGMIAWLKVRQKAVDDAKRDTPHRNVRVWHYTEVNLAVKALEGGKTVTNDVLPHAGVDYVSYSCYDALQAGWRDGFNDPEAFARQYHRVLDHIESKLPPKEGVPGKRVYIGEYGFPLRRTKTAEVQDRYSRVVMRAALEWGCPFVLYWEFYCNENRDGSHRGFWMVDDKNVKQPIYHTHRRFYEKAAEYVRKFKRKEGRAPTPEEFRERALSLLAEPEEKGR